MFLLENNWEAAGQDARPALPRAARRRPGARLWQQAACGPGRGGGAAAEDEHTVPPSGGAGQARLAEPVGGRAHSARGPACGLPEPNAF